MIIKIRPLSEATIDKWHQTVWQVKQAQELFVSTYRSSLEDVAGKNWKKTFTEWENYVEVTKYVEDEIKSICINSGMDVTVFNRYRTAARKICFHSTEEEELPFNIAANFSLKDMQKAEKMIKQSNDGSLKKRTNRAYATIRAERQNKHIVKQMGVKATVLPTINDNDDVKHYRSNILNLLKTHFDKSSRCLKGNDKSAIALKTISGIINDYLTGARTKILIEEVA
jgi:hypothetical protein